MKYKKYILELIQHALLITVSFIAALPILSCILASFKTQEELANNNFFSFPSSAFYSENYIVIWKSGFGRALIVTMIIVICAVLISCLLNAMTAYVLCRFNFVYKRIIYFVILVSSFIPTITMQIYVFQMMADFRLVNTLLGYTLLVCGIDIVSIFIFNRYFSTIPNSIDEAAILDGCSYTGVFFTIHLPLLRQAFLTAAILKTIFIYNEYYIANLYLLDKTKYLTVTTLLYSFSAPFGTQYNIISAGVIMAALPTVILFVIFQKRIYNGLISAKNSEID